MNPLTLALLVTGLLCISSVIATIFQFVKKYSEMRNISFLHQSKTVVLPQDQSTQNLQETLNWPDIDKISSLIVTMINDLRKDFNMHARSFSDNQMQLATAQNDLRKDFDVHARNFFDNQRQFITAQNEFLTKQRDSIKEFVIALDSQKESIEQLTKGLNANQESIQKLTKLLEEWQQEEKLETLSRKLITPSWSESEVTEVLKNPNKWLKEREIMGSPVDRSLRIRPVLFRGNSSELSDSSLLEALRQQAAE